MTALDDKYVPSSIIQKFASFITLIVSSKCQKDSKFNHITDHNVYIIISMSVYCEGDDINKGYYLDGGWLFLGFSLEYASHYLCQKCHEASTLFVSTITVNTKSCAWLMAFLTKIMRSILQVKA